MDDESLEDQINQAKYHLPARIPEIYDQQSEQERAQADLRTASVTQTYDGGSKHWDPKANPRRLSRTDYQQRQAMSQQVTKMGKSISGAALSANSLGIESHNSMATEVNKEAADIALLGAAGLVRGIKSGLEGVQGGKEAKPSGEIPSSSPEAIEAFIAKLPPPPKAIAAPLKRLPPPGRYAGPERD